METEGLVPGIIVTAIGAAALGGPDALRVLLEFAGRSPVADIAISVFVIGMLTAHLLGVVLLARFVRKPPRAQRGAACGGEAPRPRAPVTDCFANMTLLVSVGVAFLVAACLVVVPGGGLMSSVRLVFDIAGKSPVGAAGSFPFIMPLLRVRVFHEAGNADAAAPAKRAKERLAGVTRTAGLSLAVGIGLLLFNSFVKPGGLDALRLFHGFFTNTFFGIGAAAVVGTVLLPRLSRRTAGAGAVVPAPATGAERFGKPRQNAFLVALVCIALAGVLSVIQYAYAPPAHKSDGGKHACSAFDA